MKKILSLLLVVIMLVSTIPFVYAEDVIQITDAAGLAAIANQLDGSYKLMNNITLENSWTPIGGSSAFTGTFEGNCKTINGLNVNLTPTSTTVYAGLFANNSGTIKNLKVNGTVTVNSTNNSSTTIYAGGVAGYCGLLGTIEGCTADVAVSAILAPTAATGSGWSGTYTGKVYAGGVVGYSASWMTISESCSKNTVTAKATLTAASGKTANATAYAGGIAGYCSTIENACNNANIAAQATSTSGTAAAYVGGVAGRASTIRNAYSSGSNISGTGKDTCYVGGVAGELSNASGCYYLNTSATKGFGYSGNDTQPTVTALTSTNMRKKASYPEFDFSNVWELPFLSTPALLSKNEVISGTVTIDGTKEYNNTLTANVSAVTPEKVHTGTIKYIKYQWYRCAEYNGEYTAIEDATAQTYTTTTADIGNYIMVVVTGRFTYGGSVKSAPSIISKATPATPPAPTLNTATSSSITLNTISGCEYLMQTYSAGLFGIGAGWSGSAWQDSPEFTGLNAGTEYRFAQRVKGTDYVNQSTASEYANFTTLTVASDVIISGTVTVTGTAKKGQTLRAVITEVVPSNINFTYQWYRDSSAISGAVSQTYVLTESDIGKKMSVKLTADQAGYTGSLTSAQTVAVVSDVITIGGTVTISGDAIYGKTLTAVTTNVTPAGVPVTYQWYRGNSLINGATAKTYKLTVDDIGSTVKVIVTAKQAGYTGSVSSAQTAAVTKIPSVKPVAPVAEKVGVKAIKLEATTGYEYAMATKNWFGSWSTSLTWQDSPEFTGLTENTEYRFYQRVKGTNTVMVSDTSDYLQITTASVVTISGTVSISGAARVGGTFTANTSAVVPAAAPLTYQWYKNGAPLSGATNKTLVLTAEDEGATFTVKVTATGDDYKGSLTSEASSAVILGYMLGDVDEDGVITTVDARLALRSSVGLETLSADQKLAADVDGDGVVETDDARTILRVCVGLESLAD